MYSRRSKNGEWSSLLVVAAAAAVGCPFWWSLSVCSILERLPWHDAFDDDSRLSCCFVMSPFSKISHQIPSSIVHRPSTMHRCVTNFQTKQNFKLHEFWGFCRPKFEIQN
jgi:hypothetical protein